MNLYFFCLTMGDSTRRRLDCLERLRSRYHRTFAELGDLGYSNVRRSTSEPRMACSLSEIRLYSPYTSRATKLVLDAPGERCVHSIKRPITRLKIILNSSTALSPNNLARLNVNADPDPEPRLERTHHRLHRARHLSPPTRVRRPPPFPLPQS